MGIVAAYQSGQYAVTEFMTLYQAYPPYLIPHVMASMQIESVVQSAFSRLTEAEKVGGADVMVASCCAEVVDEGEAVMLDQGQCVRE